MIETVATLEELSTIENISDNMKDKHFYVTIVLRHNDLKTYFVFLYFRLVSTENPVERN